MWIWWLNHLVNPLVRWLLRSRWHGLLSASTMLVAWQGRRSGRAHVTPVNYVREGDLVYVAAGMPGQNQWWRNFREPYAATLTLSATAVAAEGRVLPAGEMACEMAIGAYLERFPSAASMFVSAEAPVMLIFTVADAGALTEVASD